MIRRPPRSTRVRSSAASDVYKRQPRGFALVRRAQDFRQEGSECVSVGVIKAWLRIVGYPNIWVTTTIFHYLTDSSGLLSYPTQIVKGSIWLYLAAHPGRCALLSSSMLAPFRCSSTRCWPRRRGRAQGSRPPGPSSRRHRACPRLRTCARRPPTTPGGRGMADIRLSGYLELSARYPVYLTLPG